MFKLRHEDSVIVAIGWALAGLGVAVLQVLSLVGLLMSAIQPTCVYQARRITYPRALRDCMVVPWAVRKSSRSSRDAQEDCNLGYACVSVPTTASAPPHSATVDTLCMACDYFGDFNSGALFQYPATWFPLTPRTEEGLVNVTNVTDYCAQQLRLPKLQTWPEPPQDYSRCLVVQESLMKLTPFGLVVLAAAFIFISGSLASERHQQLFNSHLRHSWFPAPHKHWRPAVLKLTEVVLARGSLPFVMTALLSLLARTSFGAQDVLLNGLSLSFIVVIDDELFQVVTSVTQRDAIKDSIVETAKGAGEARTFSEMQRKACGTFFLCNFALCLGMALILNQGCAAGDQTAVGTVGTLVGMAGGLFLDLAVHVVSMDRMRPCDLAKTIVAEVLETLASVLVVFSLYWLAVIGTIR
eukprot:7366246-Prymnesium_polylepis.1